MTDVLSKLDDVYGTVAGFDVLMKSFYCVQQSRNKRVSAFIMRLEGTLSDIPMKNPSRVMEQQAQQHLCDCLFYGFYRHLRDSLRYMYDNSLVTYSKLMLMA